MRDSTWQIRIDDDLPPLTLKSRGQLRDINGCRRYFTIEGPPIVVQQSTYREKAFVLQRIRFEDNGTVELRLGYFIIGKKPRRKGQWVWGQYCPLIPEKDFKKLIMEAQKRGWLGDEEDAYLDEVTRQRMATFDRQKALTHEQVWGAQSRRRKNKP